MRTAGAVDRVRLRIQVGIKGAGRVGDIGVGFIRVGNVRVGVIRVGNVRVGVIRVGVIRSENVGVGNVGVGNVRVGNVGVGNVGVGDVGIGRIRFGIIGLRCWSIRSGRLRLHSRSILRDDRQDAAGQQQQTQKQCKHSSELFHLNRVSSMVLRTQISSIHYLHIIHEIPLYLQ